MNLDNIKKGAKVLQKKVIVNSPTILTGIAVAGLLATTISAVKATPRAIELIEEEEYNRREMISKKDMVIVTWKVWVPTGAFALMTIGCIIGANKINLRRNAAIASMYTIAETTLREYQSKVVETIGENKAKKIKEEISQDKLNNNPVGEKKVIVTGNGETLCYDSLSGRYFKSTIEDIKKAQNDLNKRLISEMWVSLNDLYDLMGLELIKMGDDMGWNVDNLIDIDFDAMIATDGQPCIVINHNYSPSPEFRY